VASLKANRVGHNTGIKRRVEKSSKVKDGILQSPPGKRGVRHVESAPKEGAAASTPLERFSTSLQKIGWHQKVYRGKKPSISV